MAKSVWAACGAMAGLMLCAPNPASAAVPDTCKGFRETTVARLKTTCVHNGPKPGDTCKVVFSGAVRVAERFGHPYYQLMKFSDGDTAGVIFVPAGRGRLHPLACAENSAAYYHRSDTPRLLSKPYGLLLELPPVDNGNAGVWNERLLVWRDERWTPIDTEYWLTVFWKRMRATYNYGAKMNNFSLKAMTGYLELSRENWAPPYDHAEVHLALRNDKLVLTKVRLIRDSP